MSATGFVVVPGSGEAISWGDVQGKPETFPPASHAHDYAATGHSHPAAAVAWADVTGKPATFPPATHSHAYADITGKPATFPPDAHLHEIEEVDNLAEQLAEPARVFIHNGTGYELSTTTDIFIGPADPGSGLWIDTNA
jgi:hypothetical protein